MYDLKKCLDNDEKILYEGKSFPGKGSKSIKGSLLLILFIGLVQGLMIWSVVTGTGDGAYGISFPFIMIMATTLLFDVIAIYNIIYLLFLKKRLVSDDYYCITNKRVFKYESKKDKLVYGYLASYEEIKILNEKDGYGDLYMGIILKENSSKEERMKVVKEHMLQSSSKPVPIIVFESIENPSGVVQIVQNARKELLEKQN